MAVNRWPLPVQFDDSRPLPKDDHRTEVASLAIGVALGPVMAGNEVTLNAENCPNSRIAGVVFEKHFHFGSSYSSSLDESSRSSANSSRGVFASLAAYYIRNHSWICPLDSGPRYSMEDMYVGLKMKLVDRNGRAVHGDARKKKILFEPFNRSKVTPRTVLVVGGPGYGKTTLCRKIVYDWAGLGKTFPEFSSDEAVVLYLDMSCLGKDANLEEELVKLAMQDESEEPDNVTMSETAETLKSYDRNVIVVLDGYVGICEELQVQIRQLTESKPDSAFKAASVVVTSRPGIDDKTLLMFHKHFILKGFSVGLAQKLVFKYFRQSSSPLSAYYEDVLTRFQMKNLSPLVILALCDCELNKESGLNRYPCENFRKLAIRLADFCNMRNSLGLTNQQVLDKLDRLGLFFWKCLCKKRHAFNRHDLKLGLKGDFEFVSYSGLLKTKEYFDKWEPIHPVLMECLAMSYLENKWLSCRTSEDAHSFLTSLFPKTPSLQVSCYKGTKDEVRFTVRFQYKEFGMIFEIKEGERRFYLLNSSSDLTCENLDSALKISYLLPLRNKEDSRVIMHNLGRMFNKEKSLTCLAPFISASHFEELHLAFFLTCSSFTEICFCEERPDCVVSGQTVSHPLSCFRTSCQEIRLTFVKPACTISFMRSVLECTLEIQSNKLRLDNEYTVVEALRLCTLKPPLEAAHICGSKTVYYSRPKCVRVKSEPVLEALCDRLELVFRMNEMLDNDAASFL